MMKERIIMGVDPGTSVTGYGIIKIAGKSALMLNCGIIQLGKYGKDHPAKLRRIFERTLGLIQEYHPDELAVEAPFYGKNVQSMLKLGRAQGVAMAAALYRDIPIFEYAPKKVKMAITGNGNASKEQVSAMMERFFTNFEQDKYLLDASDALAVALCHSFQKNASAQGKSYSGWKSFIQQNPDRKKR